MTEISNRYAYEATYKDMDGEWHHFAGEFNESGYLPAKHYAERLAERIADAREGIPETVEVTYLACIRVDPTVENVPF